ncbi:hypothetical protein LWE61_15170 [Sphingobium sufflavum]|uniref:hypothetical protein n=1 Tax=Sphingobium sufflavum TaxID=1129547 RepID=UPI001F2915EA|nr:hypothetical protein [Sphingobium sufflavum]MCE7797890.1 hypothetical protein [Sphingobium sufflavum]
MDHRTFRASLVKIMPGYRWTVHKAGPAAKRLVATGIQSSGLNRISTLQVTCASTEGGEYFTARSAGFGRRAPWLHQNGDRTLARALRGLQIHYRAMAASYSGHEQALENGRRACPENLEAAHG